MVAHRDIQYESLKKYGLVVTCLICFVFRCFEGWACRYSMKLSSSQEEMCRHLRHALREQRTSCVEDEMELFVDDDMCLGLEDKELDDFDDEEHEDLEEMEEGSTEVRQGLVENGMQHCLLELLISLFTHLPSGSDDKFYSPIYRFLILFSLKKNGQWLAGRRITQLFAALLFCGREVMMALMHRELMQRSDSRYSEWVSCFQVFASCL